MTITTNIQGGKRYPGNGATAAFTVPWRVDSAAELAVSIVDDVTYIETTPSYVITDLGAPFATVTITPAPVVGTTVKLVPDLEFTQPVNLRSQRVFNPEAVEAALDRQTKLLAQLPTIADTLELIERQADPVGISAAVLRADMASPAVGKGGALVAFSQTGTGSVTRDQQSKSRERMSALDKIPVSEHAAIRAKTSVLDVTAYINQALTEASADGRDVFLPGGKYKLTSGLFIDESADTDDYNPRAALIGEGPSNTILEFGAGNYFGLTIQGGGGAGGSHVNMRTGGFSMQKTDRLGVALSLNDLAYFAVRDVFASGWQYGVKATDCLTGELERLTMRNNDYGVQLEGGGASSPNAISLISCEIGINKYAGVTVIDGGSITFYGGAVEGNGWVGGGLGYGVLITDAGSESGVGLAIHGTYFEANEGVADVWIKNTNGVVRHVAHDITGATFGRISAALFVTNNIRIENLSTSYVAVKIGGCGFKRFGAYAVNAGRQYINKINSGGGTVRINTLGNFFMDATEHAELSGIADTDSSLPTAWGRFSVTGGGPVNVVETKNMPSCAYDAAGAYTVTMTEGVTGASYAIQVTANHTAFCNMVAYTLSATTIKVLAFDAAGVAMNPTGFSIEVKALRL